MQRLPGAIFQQDDARTHTVRVSQDCTVTTLPWPALSPYFSSIEHIWDHLGRRVVYPKSLNELEARVQQPTRHSDPTDLTSTYSECTRRVFGGTGIEPRPSGLESDALNQACPPTAHGPHAVHLETFCGPIEVSIYIILDICTTDGRIENNVF
ncbi:transposable element Tcb2 transposase [Trichonephila clavipes]|nr:transposable element Tcb2 transposase [Trichonephila clavipes]